VGRYSGPKVIIPHLIPRAPPAGTLFLGFLWPGGGGGPVSSSLLKFFLFLSECLGECFSSGVPGACENALSPSNPPSINSIPLSAVQNPTCALSFAVVFAGSTKIFPRGVLFPPQYEIGLWVVGGGWGERFVPLLPRKFLFSLCNLLFRSFYSVLGGGGVSGACFLGTYSWTARGLILYWCWRRGFMLFISVLVGGLLYPKPLSLVYQNPRSGFEDPFSLP